MKVTNATAQLVGEIRPVTRRAGFDRVDRGAILARNAVASALWSTEPPCIIDLVIS